MSVRSYFRSQEGAHFYGWCPFEESSLFAIHSKYIWINQPLCFIFTASVIWRVFYITSFMYLWSGLSNWEKERAWQIFILTKKYSSWRYLIKFCINVLTDVLYPRCFMIGSFALTLQWINGDYEIAYRISADRTYQYHRLFLILQIWKIFNTSGNQNVMNAIKTLPACYNSRVEAFLQYS